MDDVLALILAGGQGDRLSILSEQRAKPAVVFGGNYRIIDFVLSNCANSGIDRVAVLTQYRPRSLFSHIGSGRAWGLDGPDHIVQILQPYLGREDMDWYQGTADAVYQNLYVIAESRAREVLILSADHIYLTSYRNLLAYHRAQGADVTMGVYPVAREDAHRFGVMELDNNGRVTDFEEKPADPKYTWASMGIYCFDRDLLVQALQDNADQGDATGHDFGRDIIPQLIGQKRVFGYQYHEYWRDVGTVDAYFESNMDLLAPNPQLRLNDRDMRLRTAGGAQSPALAGPEATIHESLISAGARIDGTVERSVISPGVVVEQGAVVRNSVIHHDAVIRAGATVDHAIIDKEVVIGPGAVVGEGDASVPNRARPDIVTSGISIIGKRVIVPAGMRIGRNVIVGAGVHHELEGLDVLTDGETILPEQMPLHLFV